jgi:biotin carboxyl carrier protein
MGDNNELSIVIVDGTAYESQLTSKFKRRKPYTRQDPDTVRCFIPGIIQKIHVREGQKVAEGDSMLILEAMKMQNDVPAPRDGRVKAVLVYEGQMATKGQALVELEPGA